MMQEVDTEKDSPIALKDDQDAAPERATVLGEHWILRVILVYHSHSLCDHMVFSTPTEHCPRAVER
jgi:hypothetical protein